MSNEVAASKSNNAKDAKDPKPKKEGFAKKAGRFFREIRSEFKKIVWPSKKQVLNNTAVVLVFMVVCAIVIWLLDWAFINLFGLLF